MLIQEYQFSWEKDFNKIKDVILSHFQKLPIRIEHVGSTAIKGLAAKPIIDIDIIFYKRTTLMEVNERLKEIGYYHIGNLGIEDRDVFKRDKRNENHFILDNIAHHLYACPVDSVELKRHITFRNYLRDNESERKEYEMIKMNIAKQANQQRKRYAELKESMARKFVESVLLKAKIKNYR